MVMRTFMLLVLRPETVADYLRWCRICIAESHLLARARAKENLYKSILA